MANKIKKITYFDTDELENFRLTCKFIAQCDVNQRACIVNEVLMLNPIVVFNREIKSLDSVCTVGVNGDAIQLNLGDSPHD